MPDFSLPLTLVFIGANAIFRGRDRIVREPVGIDAVPVWIPDLFIRRPIAFDGALVGVGIVWTRRPPGCTMPPVRTTSRRIIGVTTNVVAAAHRKTTR